MKIKSGILAFAIVIAFVLPAQAQAEGDAAAGRDKSFTCSGCHAVAGMRNAYPGYTVPKIAGQNYDYLLAALKAYREGSREHATMHAQSAQFSDQDIEDIATYFSTLSR